MDNISITEATQNKKVYVDVYASFSKDGRLLPKRIIWEDGRIFDIDRICDIRRAASLKAGGVGIRYTCVIHGREVYLFYEENYQWFMERAGA